MKTFLVFITVGLMTAMAWVLFFKFDVPNQNISAFTPIDDISSIEEPTQIVPEPIEEPTVEEQSEKPSPTPEPENRATPAGATIKNGEYLYYKQGQFIVKVKMVGVEAAPQPLASQVKTDIPEATQYKIWTVKFEQSLHNGLQVYGSTTGLNMFNVSNVEGNREAYLLNTTGDYSECPAKSIFGKDFAEDYEAYTQCFIVASNSAPVLLFTGESGSEYSFNPVVLE
jgi:hypothetical protein